MTDASLICWEFYVSEECRWIKRQTTFIRWR